MLQHYLLCLVGFVLLYYGADWLVKGSSGLARRFHITPLVIGLTVVAFGTSAPELVVSVVASAKGKSMIAVGNVVGSNICNIALVLGASALFHPIRAQRSVITRDIPIMLGVSALLLLLSWNDLIGRGEGALLFAGIILYTLFNYIAAQRERTQLGGLAGEPDTGAQTRTEPLPKQLALIAVGIGGVVYGADLVVGAAEAIMRHYGVGEKFVGLTVVAFGTSLPELATSVVAAVRRELDISIGNLVGSNVFNIMSVLGLSALVRPIPVPGGFIASGLVVDYAVMFAISALPLALMARTNTVSRRGGLCLLACYAGYLGYLVAKL